MVAVFMALTKSLLSSNIELYEMQYSFINRIRQLVASIQTIGDKRITVLPTAPPPHYHPHRLTRRNQCLESFEMIDVEFDSAFPLIQRCTSSKYRALLSTHLFVISTHIETLTVRLSFVAFTLIMTSPCFVWRGNGKR